MSDDPVPAAISALSVQIAGLEAQLAGLVAQLAETRAAILERLDHLEDRFNEMGADVQARFNRSGGPATGSAAS